MPIMAAVIIPISAANSDYAFGANVAGAVVGGFCESFSLLLGFRYLLLVAGLFYLFSGWAVPQVVKAR